MIHNYNIYKMASIKIEEDVFKNIQLQWKHPKTINYGLFTPGSIGHTYNEFLCFRRALVVSAALNDRPFREQCSLWIGVLQQWKKNGSTSGKNWWKDRIDILCNCFSLFCFIDEGGSSEKNLYFSYITKDLLHGIFFYLSFRFFCRLQFNSIAATFAQTM